MNHSKLYGKEASMADRQKFANLDGKNDEGKDADAANGGNGDKDTKDDEGKGGSGNGADPDPKPDTKPDPKYTDEDLDKLINRAIAKERKRAERAVQDAKEQMTEAQKLEKMTDLERAEHEAEKQRKRADELEKRQNLADQMKVARKELGDADITLPDELLSMFVSPEAEATKEAIGKVKELWPKAVQKAVEDALKRNPPQAEAKPAGTSVGAAMAAKKAAEFKNR